VVLGGRVTLSAGGGTLPSPAGSWARRAAASLSIIFVIFVSGCGRRNVDGWVPTRLPIGGGIHSDWHVWTAPGAPIWFGYGRALARIEDDDFSLELGLSALLTSDDRDLGPFGGTGANDFWIDSVFHFDGQAWRRDSTIWPGGLWPRNVVGCGAMYGADPSHYWIVDSGAMQVFDGSAWTPAVAPNEGVAIHGTSKDDVHIIGRQKLHHFDGKTWSQTGALASDKVPLIGVWARSPTEAYGATPDRLLRYDGARWSDLPAPKLDTRHITGCGEELYLASESEVLERTSQGNYVPALQAPENWRVSCLFCNAGILIACTNRYDAQGREVIVWVRR